VSIWLDSLKKKEFTSGKVITVKGHKQPSKQDVMPMPNNLSGCESIKTLKTYLGRVVRDIDRKTNIITPELKDALTQAKRLLKQQRRDSHKLYSLREPHVSCTSKGNAHKKYEFGNKVSVCVTKKKTLLSGPRASRGIPTMVIPSKAH